MTCKPFFSVNDNNHSGQYISSKELLKTIKDAKPKTLTEDLTTVSHRHRFVDFYKIAKPILIGDARGFVHPEELQHAVLLYFLSIS